LKEKKKNDEKEEREEEKNLEETFVVWRRTRIPPQYPCECRGRRKGNPVAEDISGPTCH
jgi:hypothetical protein